ncbi:MAG: hypothetical protein WCI27_06840 [Candidatus Omnitrophota bacterium]
MLIRRAQTLIEYVVLISVIVAGLVYMLPRVKRNTQSMIKLAADQIGNQSGAEQDMSADAARLQSSNTLVRTQGDNWRNDALGWSNRTILEVSDSTTNSLTNMGFLAD